MPSETSSQPAALFTSSLLLIKTMAPSDSDSDSSSRIDDVQPVAAADKSKKKAASKGKAKAASKTVDKSAAMITSSDDESSSSDDEPAAGDVSVVRIAKELFVCHYILVALFALADVENYRLFLLLPAVTRPRAT